MARRRTTEPEAVDPLFLQVSAKWLESGVPHDGPAMTRRAEHLGLSPEQHRDAAVAALAAAKAARARTGGPSTPTMENL